MKSDRVIGVIVAAMLLVSSFVGVPAIAQQNEAAALFNRAAELYRAGKFSESIAMVGQIDHCVPVRQVVNAEHPRDEEMASAGILWARRENSKES
jgi:hypothetical protein